VIICFIEQCGICGEPHATRDCPLAPSRAAANSAATGVPPVQVNMDEVRLCVT
jgi:hypothetical protein